MQSIHSQERGLSKIHFIKVSNLEGLKVLCILKDHDGFMWFGTENGLYRYDGYNTELINSTSSKIRLSSDVVLSLCEDKQANLWIGTGNGLQQLSADRQSIKTYLASPNATNANRKSIYAIAEIHDGSIWCSSNDGYLYRSANKKSFLRIAGTFVASYKNITRAALYIMQDSNRNVWVTDNRYGFQKLNVAGQVLDSFCLLINST